LCNGPCPTCNSPSTGGQQQDCGSAVVARGRCVLGVHLSDGREFANFIRFAAMRRRRRSRHRQTHCRTLTACQGKSIRAVQILWPAWTCHWTSSWFVKSITITPNFLMCECSLCFVLVVWAIYHLWHQCSRHVGFVFQHEDT
jgi:hypothetical protein